MREYDGQREARTQRDQGEQGAQAEGSEHEQHADHTQFSTTGPIPPVLTGFRAPAPSASELAFGPTLASVQPSTVSASPAQNHADDVVRTESIYETAQGAATGILGALVPGYLAARDQRDEAAVAELGGRMVAAFSVVHGAKAALDQMLRKVPHHSVRGASVDEDFALASTQQAVEAKAPRLTALIPTVDAAVATTLTPHVFRGQEVAGQAVVVSLDGPGAQNLPTPVQSC